jgi:O-antigen ligase
MLCVAAMLLTYVWRFQSVFPTLAVVRLTELATLGAYGLYLISADPRRRVARLRHPITLLVLALFVMMLISVPLSLYPSGSFGFIRADFIKTLLFMLVLAASVRAFIDVERIAAVQVIGAAVYSVAVLRSARVTDMRLEGLGGLDANDYSMFLVCSLPLAIFFITHSRSRLWRGLAVVAALPILTALVRAGSRAAFLGLLTVFAYFVIAYGTVPKRIRIGLSALAILAFSAVASDQYWARMSTLLTPQEDYNVRSYSGRKEVWKRGIGYMLQRPIAGVGVGNFGTAEGRLAERAQGPDYGRGWKWSSAHNSFIEVGAELGIPGLLIFVAMLACAFRTLGKMGRAPPGVARPGFSMAFLLIPVWMLGFAIHTLGKMMGRAPPGLARPAFHAAFPRYREHRGGNTTNRVPSQSAMAQALVGSLLGYLVVGFFLSQAYTAFLYSLLAMSVGLAKVSAVNDMPPAEARRVGRRRRSVAHDRLVARGVDSLPRVGAVPWGRLTDASASQTDG